MTLKLWYLDVVVTAEFDEVFTLEVRQQVIEGINLGNGDGITLSSDKQGGTRGFNLPVVVAPASS